MRLEQLVLFGPSDNFCVQFGPRVTVLAGLDDGERRGMLQTLIDAMAGRIPNASVIFVDQAGRRVYADRTGATYADTGVQAPSLSELLGTDPKVVSDLVSLRPEDLGLGSHRTEELIDADRQSAVAASEALQAEHDEAVTFLVEITAWDHELAQLDEAIRLAPEAAARWEWTQLRNQLDLAQAELASLDRNDDHEAADARLLDAVEHLRSAGEDWAEASAAATELGLKLGPLPPVSDADLARVAATPEALPDDFEDRLADLSVTTEIRTAAEQALTSAQAPAADPEDGIVYALAQLDQEALWAAHDAARNAQINYEAELEAREEDTDLEAETAIEATHHEVVRCQREVDRRFRPGILGASALAVGSLLAGQSVSLVVGVLMLMGAVAMGVWLLVLPRKALAVAQVEEEMALSQSDAVSWLGLHLRRIDDVMTGTDRKGLNAAVDLRSSTRLDWEELTNGTSLDAATSRRDAIRSYAEAIDPRARAAREKVATEGLAHAVAEESAARQALIADLAGYGLSDDGGADLKADQLRSVLKQRVAAGSFARQAMALRKHQAAAKAAGALLDRLLGEVGFAEGDLAGRLDRAIVAVEAARRRRLAAEDTQSRGHLEMEIERLRSLVEADRQPMWDITPDPTEPPVSRAALLDERRALASKVVSVRRPDVADIERRMNVTAERLRMLDSELATLHEGPTAVRRRLADRIARTTWIGPSEETLPILIDDALVGVEPAELFKLLDMIVRLSDRTQIVLLSSDPTIAKWARREAAQGVISLFEADGVAVR